ncbi:MAG TPA: hypothetical protein VLD57_07145 [Blastocatellia bacterium]|nr:hypothetical protein [Blastocatellia bacterium]
MSRIWIGEYSDSMEQEAWRGYEFWSAQVEAEMDLPGEEGAELSRLVSEADTTALTQEKGAGDVLPF